MNLLKRDKKDEESSATVNPFLHLDKTTVLQEVYRFLKHLCDIFF